MTLRVCFLVLVFTSILVPLRADDSVPRTVVDRNGKELKLVWNEEFNVDGMPDANIWRYQVGYVRNKESQYYTEARPENIFQKDGFLTIRTLKESYPIADKPNNDGKDVAEYTSAAIDTKGNVAWIYGRYEIRARFPKGKGIWPAIWMQREHCDEKVYGEIDIMEYVGFEPCYTHATVHAFKKEPDDESRFASKGHYLLLDAPEEKFHVYALEWEPDRLTIFADDQIVLEYNRDEEEPKTSQWPFDEPHFMILNTALGGSWGGEIAEDTCPTDFVIDYIRVYQ